MKMVATEDTQAHSDIQNTNDNTGAFEKLKQTLSSSLLTAQDKGNKRELKVIQRRKQKKNRKYDG